jgi:hypothetical protein
MSATSVEAPARTDTLSVVIKAEFAILSLDAHSLVTPSVPTLSAIPWTIPSESRDQGEGLYEAHFDDVGVVTVKFTPKTAPTQALVSKNPVRKDIDTLSKRDTTCSSAFTPDESALDWANEQVAHGVDGKDWKPNYAVWVNR